jgi:undecaprenyl-phosphate 4-deoxy-4-formamido-L-arabinose transferase
MRNFGQHNALLCGVRAARHAVVVTMDDDLQHPPEEVPRLLERLAEGHDVVYGTARALPHGLLRNAASRVTKLALQGAMGVDVASSVSAFRAFRCELRDAFARFENSYVSLDVLLTWGTRNFAAVPVRHDERTVGVSNYTVPKLVRHALNMITGFSTLPLRFASLLGFGLTLFGVGVLVYVVGRYLLSGGGMPGFPFLASIIAIFSGAQLFALGILGEYLARMHTRMQDRPTFIVRNRAGRE